MLIISRTPVRVSFFGGGTDYLAYYKRKKGAVLGITIDKYTYITLKKGCQFFPHAIRIAYSRTELINHLEEITHPSIRESLRFTGYFFPLDIHIFSDLPARTGLGSSSSFTVGFLNALYALQGKKIPKEKLAKEACYIEQELIKENVGSQDQYHAAYGGFNIIEFSEHHNSLRPVIISNEKKKLLEKHFMLFYTGLTRHASEILQTQVQKTCEKKNDSFLERMYEMVFEAEALLQKEEGETLVKKFAELLDQSWELKKKLSSNISTEKIDSYYQKAKEAGALGGKLCGAGQGGFLALFVPVKKQEDVKKALQPLFPVSVGFEEQGSSIIYMKD